MSLGASASLVLGNKDGNISPKAMQSLQKTKSQPSLFQNSQSTQENSNTCNTIIDSANNQAVVNNSENNVETTGTMAYSDSVETTGTMAYSNNSFSAGTFSSAGTAATSCATVSTACSASISCVA